MKIDYIRERLLRQRELLARILLGGDMEAEAERRRQGSEPPGTDGSAAGAAFPMMSPVSQAAAGWEETPGKSLRLSAQEDVRKVSGWSAAGADAELSDWESAAGTAPARERRGGGFSAESIPPDEETPAAGTVETLRSGWREVTELIAAPPAKQDGAKALSRLVQRDARRYDGGFTLY